MNHLIYVFVSFLSPDIAGFKRPSKLKKVTGSQNSLVQSADFHMCQEKYTAKQK